MKVRNSFVSNSSSCSFIITNKSKKTLTIVDFVKENPQLIENFKSQYDWHKDDPKFTQENLILSAENRLKRAQEFKEAKHYVYPPGFSAYVVFGDEQGDLIGEVFDYILRDGGNSENFKWEMYEMLR